MTIQYDGSSVSLVVTALNTMAANTWWQSAFIDNNVGGTPSTSVSDFALDCQVQVTIVIGAGTAGADKACYVYAYSSLDAGTTYPDAITGSQGTFTPNNPTQLRAIGIVNTPTVSTTYKSNAFSVASAFGFMPARWGIAIWNNSGSLLGSGNAVVYQAIKQ